MGLGWEPMRWISLCLYRVRRFPSVHGVRWRPEVRLSVGCRGCMPSGHRCGSIAMVPGILWSGRRTAPTSTHHLYRWRYTWWTRTWGTDGYGPWSEGVDFSYGLCEPITPAGPVSEDETVEFAWTQAAVPWNYVEISREGRQYAGQWVGNATSWLSDVTREYGSYTWRLRSWAPGGFGPWSDPQAFTVGDVLPEAPVTSDLVWDVALCRSAEWYHVWLKRNSGDYFVGWVADADTLQNGDLRFYPVSMPAGDYTLRIRPWATGRKTGAWSLPCEFTVP